MSVTPEVHTALIEAVDRLLANDPQHSDGSLTVASLARAAGISRATAYRANDVLELFRQRVDERSSGPDVPATLRERIQEPGPVPRGTSRPPRGDHRPSSLRRHTRPARPGRHPRQRATAGGLARQGTSTSVLIRAGRGR
jgi:hypothetical protein